MEAWFLFSIATLASWGLWGFFSGLAVENIEPKSALIYEIIGELVIGAVVVSIIGFSISVGTTPILTGIIAGTALLFGMLMFFTALDAGKTSIVVPLTALYPIITIILGYLILNETISTMQGLGMVLALIAAYLLRT